MTLTMKQSLAGAGYLLLALGVAEKGLAQQAGAPAATFSPYVGAAQGFQPEPFTTRPAVQAVQAPQAARPASGEEAERAAPTKPGEQRLKIHGHWLIDVKNADGTLVKHLDFENSLTTGGGAGTDQGSTGDQLVAALLSGSASPSDPGISFVQAPSPGTSIPAGTDVTGVCSGGSGVPGYACGILTTAKSVVNYYNGYALSVESGLSTVVNFRPNVNWVLSGSYTIPGSGLSAITAVQTLLPLCVTNAAFLSSSFDLSLQGSGAGGTQTIAPSTCTVAGDAGVNNITYGPLTQTTVPGAPLAVTPGQVLTVTVILSFS